jgi:hypothetical protein
VSIVEEREQALVNQLAGGSPRVQAEEATTGVEAAKNDQAKNGYGVGVGCCKQQKRTGSLDGIRLIYAVSDGSRHASVDVIVSGSTLAWGAGGRRASRVDVTEVELLGGIAVSRDRYATLCELHPITL